VWGVPAAHALDGEWIEFLGWCPDARCYAYSVVKRQTVRDQARESVEHRLVELGKGATRPQVRRYPSVAAAQRRAGVPAFVPAVPAPAEYDAEGAIRFTLDDGRLLTFALTVDAQLGYRVTLTDGGPPVEVATGRYDDLYPQTDAFAYVSPDGRAVALLVYGQNPWRVRGEVHYMRLPPRAMSVEPPPPPTPGAPSPDAPPPAPDAPSPDAPPPAPDAPPPDAPPPDAPPPDAPPPAPDAPPPDAPPPAPDAPPPDAPPPDAPSAPPDVEPPPPSAPEDPGPR
jgi:hypothetical protein